MTKTEQGQRLAVVACSYYTTSRTLCTASSQSWRVWRVWWGCVFVGLQILQVTWFAAQIHRGKELWLKLWPFFEERVECFECLKLNVTNWTVSVWLCFWAKKHNLSFLDQSKSKCKTNTLTFVASDFLRQLTARQSMEMEDQAKTRAFICRFEEHKKDTIWLSCDRSNYRVVEMRWALSLQLFQDARYSVTLQTEPPAKRQCVRRPGTQGMVFHWSWDTLVAELSKIHWLQVLEAPMAKGVPVNTALSF